MFTLEFILMRARCYAPVAAAHSAGFATCFFVCRRRVGPYEHFDAARHALRLILHAFDDVDSSPRARAASDALCCFCHAAPLPALMLSYRVRVFLRHACLHAPALRYVAASHMLLFTRLLRRGVARLRVLARHAAFTPLMPRRCHMLPQVRQDDMIFVECRAMLL